MRPRPSLAVVGVGLGASVLALGLGGCALFGANLPPGRAGGSFTEEPIGVPAFSDTMLEQRNLFDDAVRRHLDAEVDVLRDLVTSSNALREQLRSRKRTFISAWERNDEVSGLDAELVLDGAHWLIELDLLLYNFWTQYRAYLPYGSEPDPYAPSQGANVLSTETRTKGGLLALAAEMVRMDNARVVVEILGGELALAQWLNRGDASRGIPPESFDRMIGGYRDPDHREHLQALLRGLDDVRARVATLAANDADVDFLVSLLAESDVAREIASEGPLGRGLRFTRTILERSASTLLSPALDLYIAAAFADPGAFVPRAVRRVATVPGVAERVDATILPLDVILVEETRLGVPAVGYSRAFVYLGDARAIRASAGAEHAAIATHGAGFRRGRVFLEVDDQGVHLRTLDEVLGAQDIALLRVVGATAPTDDATDAAALRAERLGRALDTLVDERFTTPTPLSGREHAARLLYAVYGDALGVAPAPGEATPGFRRVIDALVVDGRAEVLLATDGAEPVDGDERLATVRRHREGDRSAPATDEPPPGDRR